MLHATESVCIREHDSHPGYRAPFVQFKKKGISSKTFCSASARARFIRPIHFMGSRLFSTSSISRQR